MTEIRGSQGDPWVETKGKDCLQGKLGSQEVLQRDSV